MGQAAGWSYVSGFAADPLSVSAVRNFVSAHLIEHAWPHLVDDVRTVASELATNAVLHAGTAFKASLKQANGSLILTIHDDAPAWQSNGDDPDGPEVMAAGGRGLYIVARLSRDWGVTSRVSGGKSVWAVFDAGPDSAAPRAAREFD
jgi:anti-sigma regulatory factor (Ser/Thr protein kinase)